MNKVDGTQLTHEKAMRYRKLGDIFHAIGVTSVLAYAVSVILSSWSETSKFSFFDKTWERDGFCIANRDVPHWTSHDLCLYMDTILGVAAGVVYLLLRRRNVGSGMDRINHIVGWNIIGVIGHGLAHGMIASKNRAIQANGGRGGDGRDTPVVEQLWDQGLSISAFTTIATYLIFWFPLLKSFFGKASSIKVLVFSLLSTAGGLLVPPKFGFTYVQTILSLVYSSSELRRPKEEKDMAYAGLSLLGLPLNLIAWMESALCASLVIKLGGHIVYDLYIPIALMAVYITVWMGEQKKLHRKTA